MREPKRVREYFPFAALLVGVALASGCAKTSSSAADQGTTAAATTAAAASDGATTAPESSKDPAATSDGDGDVNGLPPVYPGAVENSSLTGPGGRVSPDSPDRAFFYETKDAATTVAAWYDAHLPGNWMHTLGAPGKRTTGLFSSPDDKQIVSVTMNQPSGTVVQFSLEAGRKQ
jgi:hypothetical protein